MNRTPSIVLGTLGYISEKHFIIHVGTVFILLQDGVSPCPELPQITKSVL